MTEVEKLMKEWNDSQRNKDAWSRVMHEVELAEVITAENFRKIKAELEMLQVKMKKIEGLVEEQRKMGKRIWSIQLVILLALVTFIRCLTNSTR